jgi:hypothetical protein
MCCIFERIGASGVIATWASEAFCLRLAVDFSKELLDDPP